MYLAKFQQKSCLIEVEKKTVLFMSIQQKIFNKYESLKPIWNTVPGLVSPYFNVFRLKYNEVYSITLLLFKINFKNYF